MYLEKSMFFFFVSIFSIFSHGRPSPCTTPGTRTQLIDAFVLPQRKRSVRRVLLAWRRQVRRCLGLGSKQVEKNRLESKNPVKLIGLDFLMFFFSPPTPTSFKTGTGDCRPRRTAKGKPLPSCSWSSSCYTKASTASEVPGWQSLFSDFGFRFWSRKLVFFFLFFWVEELGQAACRRGSCTSCSCAGAAWRDQGRVFSAVPRFNKWWGFYC